MASSILRLIACTLAAIVASSSVADAGTDTLGCDAVLHDPDGVLDRQELEPVIRRTASLLDADVRVRVEGTLDGDLDRRIDQLRTQCPGWADSDSDEIADGMVVVSFSVAELENSIFYGADLGPMLEDRWDAATDAMIPHLRDEDYTDAVEAGLRGLQRDPSSTSTAGSESEFSSSSGGGDGVPGEVIFWIVLLVAIAGVSYLSRAMGWTSGSGDGESSRWYNSGSRRRSFGSFGSRSRSSSRSSSRSRSSRGSRRAGGGSKKW